MKSNTDHLPQRSASASCVAMSGIVRKPVRQPHAGSRVLSLSVLAAACALTLALAGCGSDGTSMGNTPATGAAAPSTTSTTPATTTTSDTGVATEIGKTTTDLGNVIANTPLPLGVSPQVSQGLGATVASTGDIVSDLGTGIGNGLGKIGSSSDPVGITVSSLGYVVTDAGGAVVGVGTVIGGLGNGGPLGALSPLTSPLAGAVGLVGTTIESGGQTLGATLSSGPVQQVTQQLSTAITPIVVTLGNGTQTIGSASGLGAPTDTLLQTLGSAISQGGKTVSGSTNNIVVADVGNVVSSLGNTVAGTGSVLDHNGINGAAPIAGLFANLGNVSTAPTTGAGTAAGTLGPLTGLLANLGNLGGLTTLGGGASPLAGSPLASLTGALSSVSGSSGANPLAPVTTLLGAIVVTTSNASSTAGSTGGSAAGLGAVTSLLSSVTGALGSVGGTSIGGPVNNSSSVTRASEKTPGAVVH